MKRNSLEGKIYSSRYLRWRTEDSFPQYQDTTCWAPSTTLGMTRLPEPQPGSEEVGVGDREEGAMKNSIPVRLAHVGETQLPDVRKKKKR
ncbi:unnamed protein product [Boreogadus saida]